ncbi:MAG: hypothetical protein AAF573_08285 [Bacteroidota bacterium]
MKKLKDLKNYHLGMGALILLLQLVLQISNLIYAFGLFLILFSFYESSVLKQLEAQKSDEKKVDQILSQFKSVNLLSIVLIFFFVIMFGFEIQSITDLSELIFIDSGFFTNVTVISGVMIHFHMNAELKAIKQDILSS